MDVKVILLYIFICGLCMDISQGFSCFRRYRKKADNCGGIRRGRRITTPDLCCSGKGKGFTVKEVTKLGRNKYSCVSCVAWEKQKNAPPTTPSPFGSWGEWESWQPCSVTCEGGTRSRRRQCVKTPEQQICPGSDVDTDNYCNEYVPCPEYWTSVCYRKYNRKRNTCGGPVKNSLAASAPPVTLTPEICCSRFGNGFSTEGKNKVGKNKYTCTSCEDWEKEKNKPLTTAPPVGSWGEWEAWQPCSVSCKGGTRSRRRHCVRTPEQDVCPGSDVEKNDICNEHVPCPDAEGEWGPWGQCSTSCGAGWENRFRACADCNLKPFKHMESKPCIINYYCPIDGNWGEWATWDECTKTCGAGTRQRRRMCDFPIPKYGGQECSGVALDDESCNEEPCAVNGHWTHWSRFGYCSATCGVGHMVRTRQCANPTPMGGGAPCRGSATDERRCEKRKCPRHGGWNSWGEWSSCPVTCGNGVRTRSRVCDRPRPLFGGRKCEGPNEEAESCHAHVPCPVNGGWSEWSSYGWCRGPPCQKGHQLRSRSCDNPRPQHRGRTCRGRSVERQECINMKGCQGAEPLRLHGGWCDFEPWSQCSVSCTSQSGYMIRFRECKCPMPRNRGDNCRGESRDMQKCSGTGDCDDPSVRVGV